MRFLNKTKIYYTKLIRYTWFVWSLYKRLRVNAYGAMLKSMNIIVGKWIHFCFIQFSCLNKNGNTKPMVQCKCFRFTLLKLLGKFAIDFAVTVVGCFQLINGLYVKTQILQRMSCSQKMSFSCIMLKKCQTYVDFYSMLEYFLTWKG